MKDMTKGGIYSNILMFSIPMLLGNVFQQLYNVVDSIIVGQYIGTRALAAVGQSFPIMFLLIALIMGLTMGSMVLVSQYFGAKDFANLRKTVDIAYIFIAAVSLVAMAGGLIFSRQILVLLNVPGDIFEDSVLYVNIMFVGIPFFFGYNSLSAIMRGVGDSKTPLYLLIISTVMNIILDLLFVPVFKWGIAGAAWATVISQAFPFIAGIIFVSRKNSILAVRIKSITFDKDIFKKSFKIGLPSGVQQASVALGMWALTRLVNGFGTTAAAAFTVAGRIDSFAIMPVMNFAIAASTFVGQNIGAGEIKRVKSGIKASMVISTITSAVLSVIIVITGKYLIMMFDKNPDVVRIGYDYLLIVGSFYVVFSAMFIYNGALRGAGVTFVPMIITICSMWLIRIPISTVLSKYFGVNGIWVGLPAAWVLGAVAAYIYFKTFKWDSVRRMGKPVLEDELILETEIAELEKKESHT